MSPLGLGYMMAVGLMLYFSVNFLLFGLSNMRTLLGGIHDYKYVLHNSLCAKEIFLKLSVCRTISFNKLHIYVCIYISV